MLDVRAIGSAELLPVRGLGEGGFWEFLTAGDGDGGVVAWGTLPPLEGFGAVGGRGLGLGSPMGCLGAVGGVIGFGDRGRLGVCDWADARSASALELDLGGGMGRGRPFLSSGVTPGKVFSEFDVPLVSSVVHAVGSEGCSLAGIRPREALCWAYGFGLVGGVFSTSGTCEAVIGTAGMVGWGAESSAEVGGEVTSAGGGVSGRSGKK